MSEHDPTLVPAIEDDAYDFVERQLGLLGDQDPLEVLASTPGVIARLFGRADDEHINAPWAEGKWSCLDVLAHMTLTEWVFGHRTRQVLCDPDPVLQPVEQELWTARAGARVGDCGEHLEDFVSLRRANLRLWRSLDADELLRTGVHAGAAVEMSLGFLLRLLAGHDLNHLEQIRRGLEA